MENPDLVSYIEFKNRMRNNYALIETEFGKENVTFLQGWEYVEKKIANFSNHRRFTLRCFSQKITPNSLKLKSNIKTPWVVKILQRAEKQLANEHIRLINNTIDICIHFRDTCMKELKDHINNELHEECSEFIKNVRECRHKTTLTRQSFVPIRDGHSNHSDGHTKNSHTCTLAPTTATVTTIMQLEKWVKNLLGVPLTKAQVSLLAHGPNFPIAPRHLLWGIHCHCRASLSEPRAT